MTDKPNILVLGATGKVGGAVINQLVDNKDVNVVAATRSPEKAQSFKEKGIDSVILDLDDPKTMALLKRELIKTLLINMNRHFF